MSEAPSLLLLESSPGGQYHHWLSEEIRVYQEEDWQSEIMKVCKGKKKRCAKSFPCTCWLLSFSVRSLQNLLDEINTENEVGGRIKGFHPLL